MAKIHILNAVQGGYSGLVHFNTPAGNNSAGVSWKDAGLAAGLLGGESPIAAEAAAVLAGDLVEIGVTFRCAATNAVLEEVANKEIADWIAKALVQLKWYGYSTGTVS